LLGGPSSPSQTPSSHDSDTRDEPEESVEEEPSQVLEVQVEEVEGGRFMFESWAMIVVFEILHD
jgi:hypothetical protein